MQKIISVLLTEVFLLRVEKLEQDFKLMHYKMQLHYFNIIEKLKMFVTKSDERAFL